MHRCRQFRWAITPVAPVPSTNSRSYADVNNNCGAAKHWPLVLFLYGAGDYNNVPAVIGTRGKHIGATHDFVLVAPSCHQDERWSPDLVIDTGNDAKDVWLLQQYLPRAGPR
ncbi:MAG: hypothetical protein P4L33_08800 [Capsulimonadaceae bacterium]|nr:hypothetical protein [Capsulimonadaceae bacterium]